MGNCQAIDNATLLIQHPSGRVDQLYWPVTANEIMKMHPGHYVALLLTTTVCPPLQNTTNNNTLQTVGNGISNNNNNNNNSSIPVRITRIKLLRPTDTLGLGHVYRLITTQEVMKGLKAKKYAKMKQQHPDFEQVARRSMEKNQVKHEKHRVKVAPPPTNQSAVAKSKTWQPALKSISEAGS